MTSLYSEAGIETTCKRKANRVQVKAIILICSLKINNYEETNNFRPFIYHGRCV